MRDIEAQTRSILALCDVVEELVGRVGDRDLETTVSSILAVHRAELREAVPIRLVQACGGDELAARRVLAVLDRATGQRARIAAGEE